MNHKYCIWTSYLSHFLAVSGERHIINDEHNPMLWRITWYGTTYPVYHIGMQSTIKIQLKNEPQMNNNLWLGYGEKLLASIGLTAGVLKVILLIFDLNQERRQENRQPICSCSNQYYCRHSLNTLQYSQDKARPGHDVPSNWDTPGVPSCWSSRRPSPRSSSSCPSPSSSSCHSWWQRFDHGLALRKVSEIDLTIINGWC